MQVGHRRNSHVEQLEEGQLPRGVNRAGNPEVEAANEGHYGLRRPAKFGMLSNIAQNIAKPFKDAGSFAKTKRGELMAYLEANFTRKEAAKALGWSVIRTLKGAAIGTGIIIAFTALLGGPFAPLALGIGAAIGAGALLLKPVLDVLGSFLLKHAGKPLYNLFAKQVRNFMTYLADTFPKTLSWGHWLATPVRFVANGFINIVDAIREGFKEKFPRTYDAIKTALSYLPEGLYTGAVVGLIGVWVSVTYGGAIADPSVWLLAAGEKGGVGSAIDAALSGLVAAAAHLGEAGRNMMFPRHVEPQVA